MNLGKMSVIFAMSTLLIGCTGSPDTYCKTGANTTYGVENSKWEVMSFDQRESAIEVFRLDQIRIAEESKLNVLREQKAEAIAQRKLQHKEEISRIENEDSGILEQQRKVGSVTEQEQLRQKQRQQDLEDLKS